MTPSTRKGGNGMTKKVAMSVTAQEQADIYFYADALGTNASDLLRLLSGNEILQGAARLRKAHDPKRPLARAEQLRIQADELKRVAQAEDRRSK